MIKQAIRMGNKVLMERERGTRVHIQLQQIADSALSLPVEQEP